MHHFGTGSNRSSAERVVRRLGGTPLTSPALSRVSYSYKLTIDLEYMCKVVSNLQFG